MKKKGKEWSGMESNGKGINEKERSKVEWKVNDRKGIERKESNKN